MFATKLLIFMTFIRKHLFISPHADDVVWSCGGMIAKLIDCGNLVEVITTFSGSPLNLDIKNIPGKWRLIANPKIRIKENEESLKFLNACSHSLPFFDAALRKENSQKFLYRKPEDLFKEIHPKDTLLIKKLIQAFNKLKIQNYYVHAPLGVGNHVDHILVNKAVNHLNLKYVDWYEDFPYILKNPFTKRPGLTSVFHEVNYDKWLKASLYYRSQIRMFNSIGKFKKKHLNFAMKYGKIIGLKTAQRIWQQEYYF